MQQPSQREIVEHDVRMLIGDLQLQLIGARARVVELEAMLANAEPSTQPNGLDKEAAAAAAAASPPH